MSRDYMESRIRRLADTLLERLPAGEVAMAFHDAEWEVRIGVPRRSWGNMPDGGEGMRRLANDLAEIILEDPARGADRLNAAVEKLRKMETENMERRWQEEQEKRDDG